MTELARKLTQVVHDDGSGLEADDDGLAALTRAVERLGDILEKRLAAPKSAKTARSRAKRRDQSYGMYL